MTYAEANLAECGWVARHVIGDMIANLRFLGRSADSEMSEHDAAKLTEARQRDADGRTA